MLKQSLAQAINKPAYNQQFRIEGQIFNIIADYKQWVEFFKKYAPKLNRNGELDNLIKQADRVMDSYNRIYKHANLSVATEETKASWLGGVLTEAQNLHNGLVAVLKPLYDYASSRAGANLALVEGRKEQLKNLLATTSPFDDAYAKYKEELDAYNNITNRLSKVSFELEGIIGKEIYDKYFVPPNPTPTEPIRNTPEPALVAPSTVTDLIATTVVATAPAPAPAPLSVEPIQQSSVTTSVAVPEIDDEPRTVPPPIALETPQVITPAVEVITAKQSETPVIALQPNTIATATEAIKTSVVSNEIPLSSVTASKNPDLVPTNSTSTDSVANLTNSKATVLQEFWEKNKWYIIGGVAILLIGGAVWAYKSSK